MRFTIITNKDGQQPQKSSCAFSPPGGTIGRGSDNNLILPDSSRTISRLQAIVHISSEGECQITNRGNVTQVMLNDLPLERGRPFAVKEGDIIGIDDYRLLVSSLNAPVLPINNPEQPDISPLAEEQTTPAEAPVEPKPESGLKSEPELAQERKLKPEPELLEPKPESKRKPKSESEPVSEQEPKPKRKSKSEPEPGSDLEPKPKRKPKLESEPVSEQEPKPKRKLKSEPEPEAELEPKPKRKSKLEPEPVPVPNEIWESLAQEFSLQEEGIAPVGSGYDAASHPLTEPVGHERNPIDPLASLESGGALPGSKVSQEEKDLFTHEDLFQRETIFNDTTPSTLVSPADESDERYVSDQSRQPLAETDVDPLALFGDTGHSGSVQPGYSDPLGLMMQGAVPLTPVEIPEPAVANPVKPALTARARPPEPAQQFPEPEQPLPESGFSETRSEVDFTAAMDSDIRQQQLLNDPVALEKSPLFADMPLEPQPESPPTLNTSTGQVPLPQDKTESRRITLPTPQAVQRPATPSPKGRLRIDPVATSHSASAYGDEGDVLEGELLESLLEGMGLNDMQPVPRFNSDNLHQLGQMMSMFSQGTVALLSSRSILKRGVKADMTMILDDANNPFKLLPSGKTVLMQMFGSRMPGFMPPTQSVRDALIDLQAHQLGMIAGIRAIIAAMLQSFNPARLEEDARKEGVTSRLSLPGSRKAMLWEHFIRRYNDTAGEIEDDFHTLFGEAFLHAYDMEVNQYKDSQTRAEE